MPLISTPPSDFITTQGPTTSVQVPANQTVEPPILLTLKPDGTEPHTLSIHVGQQAKATIVVRIEGEAPSTLDLKIHLKADAQSHVRLVEFQNLADTVELNCERKAEVGDGAHVEQVLMEIGGKTTTGVLIQTTAGKNAIMNASLLFVGQRDPHHTFKLTNHYEHEGGSVQLVVKSLAKAKGRISVDGMIAIAQTGVGTASHLRLESLLLSREAKVVAIPGLEIGTNAVKVGHAASVSSLNEESLFYLTSRGLSPEEARWHLIHGFVAEVADKVADLGDLKQEILKLI